LPGFNVIGDERTHMPDRDAFAVTVRVDRDGVDLGLWQTWISGIADVEIDRHTQPSITKLQRRRIAAELLADSIEEDARAGRIRDEWQLDVTVLEPTTVSAITAYARSRTSPVPDFRAGELIRSFTT
jgi:hypothetical protein